MTLNSTASADHWPWFVVVRQFSRVNNIDLLCFGNTANLSKEPSQNFQKPRELFFIYEHNIRIYNKTYSLT